MASTLDKRRGTLKRSAFHFSEFTVIFVAVQSYFCHLLSQRGNCTLRYSLFIFLSRPVNSSQHEPPTEQFVYISVYYIVTINQLADHGQLSAAIASKTSVFRQSSTSHRFVAVAAARKTKLASLKNISNFSSSQIAE